MKQIPLSNGEVTLVDDQDYAYLNQFSWRSKRSDGSKQLYHAVRDVAVGDKKLTIRMHRLITEADQDQMVLHINGDGLDNRRRNLQLRTVNPWTGRLSGFRGVHQVGFHRWRAEISYAGRVHLIGDAFVDPRMAAVAYDEVAARMFGSMALTNYPLDNYLPSRFEDQALVELPASTSSESRG